MILGKFYSAVLDKVKARIMKVYLYGPRTAVQVAPYGDDSNPVQGMDTLFCETDNDAEPIVVGFINTGLLALPGEKRFFSQKPDGSLSFYTWMKNDGTYEIGGNTKNLIRYQDLNLALQQQVAKLQTELGKISAGIATAGGVYTPGDISLDITAAKINEIKTL